MRISYLKRFFTQTAICYETGGVIGEYIDHLIQELTEKKDMQEIKDDIVIDDDSDLIKTGIPEYTSPYFDEFREKEKANEPRKLPIIEKSIFTKEKFAKILIKIKQNHCSVLILARPSDELKIITDFFETSDYSTPTYSKVDIEKNHLDSFLTRDKSKDPFFAVFNSNNNRDAIEQIIVKEKDHNFDSKHTKQCFTEVFDFMLLISPKLGENRYLSSITEVGSLRGNIITMQDCYFVEYTGLDEDNKAMGHSRVTGFIPSKIEIDPNSDDLELFRS